MVCTIQPPHGSHDLHGSECGNSRKMVGITDFGRILRGDKRHGMLSMDVVARCRCRSRVPWVRDGYLPVKPSANSGVNLYLGLSTRYKDPTRACLQLAPWDRWVWSPYHRSNPEFRGCPCNARHHRTVLGLWRLRWSFRLWCAV